MSEGARKEDPKKGMHWSEIIAEEVLQTREPPYVVMSGITTSGPLHPGTLCEFMFADAVYKSLKKKTKDAKYIFIADILDAFDNVPEPFKKYEKELAPHLGKPLAHTPDPEGCHKSFADHFLAEATGAMEKFNAHPQILRADDSYSEGKYDKYAMEFSGRKDEIKQIVQKSSLRDSMPEDWHPIMPICAQCGRVATTRILNYEDGEYEYACDRDVKYAKGCGFRGKAKISDHKYKLLWRLDWPARQAFMGTKAEGGSVDHHTRGGSVSTLLAIHREFFKKEPPIMYKFGFLKYKGKKYSKSRGIGHSMQELMELLPIPVLEYALLRPDIQEDKELVLEEKTLLPLVSDFEHASSLDPSDSALARADRKKAVARSLCGKKEWDAPLADFLLDYAIYGDWARVGELLKDGEGAAYLSKYVDSWYARGWIPDKYVFELGKGGKPRNPEAVGKFADSLREEMAEEEVQSLAFNTAKAAGVSPKELFADLYTALIGKERGPRLGKFIIAVGVGRARELLSAPLEQ